MPTVVLRDQWYINCLQSFIVTETSVNESKPMLIVENNSG